MTGLTPGIQHTKIVNQNAINTPKTQFQHICMEHSQPRTTLHVCPITTLQQTKEIIMDIMHYHIPLHYTTK